MLSSTFTSPKLIVNLQDWEYMAALKEKPTGMTK